MKYDKTNNTVYQSFEQYELSMIGTGVLDVKNRWKELEPVNIAYDSEVDTLRHIKRVNELLMQGASELLERAAIHDNSKLGTIEKPLFDIYTPKLKNTTYGSKEYKQYLKELKVALKHHYESNSHHPEFYKDGVNDMDLFDLLEMFFDWKAATERHTDGDLIKSIKINKDRFGMSEQLCKILENTIDFFKD